METKRIRLADLELNQGQIVGLPSNPREWTRTDLDKLKKSITETPELLEARGLIVWPHEGKYVILGGNMRFSALKEMNAVDAPCYVLPADTPIEKLKEIVIKDNGLFGAWDFDMLANEWDDLPLPDWGVPAWHTEPVNMEAVDALFEETGVSKKDKCLTISIMVPKQYEERVADIEDALNVTLEEWPGCEVK